MSETPRTDAIDNPLDMENEERLGAFARQLERELKEKQAQIDRLMLEYCQDEMTPEQIEVWKKHQKPVGE